MVWGQQGKPVPYYDQRGDDDDHQGENQSDEEQESAATSASKEINEEESENSYWLSGLPERRNQNSVIWKESHNNCPYSIIVSGKPQEYRSHSVLIHESREKSEIWLINEGEKNLVRLFFKKYYRLLENALLRINRYCG
jgi:hypothetical protein